jgi:HD-like signal output (HDOD) protein
MDVATHGPGTFRDEFAAAFQHVRLPVLPAAVSRLLAEVNSPAAEVERIERIIAAEPLISAKVLRTINSSHFALRTQVTSIRHAVALLGLDRIRSIVLSFAILESVPHPPTALFKHEAFWTDTLLRSLLARILSRRSGLGDEEEAFTAMMLADISVPILLTVYADTYLSVFARWRGQPNELAQLERDHVGWDHALASAWILEKWEFPPTLVTVAGAHNCTAEQIHRQGLGDTVALPVMVASLLPSALKPDAARCRNLIRVARKELNIAPPAWSAIHDQVRKSFGAICTEFKLSGHLALKVLNVLQETTSR